MSTINVTGESIQHIDATPDEGYVRRIIEAHLHNNTACRCTDNTSGAPPTNPVCVAMNEAADARAVLLRKALAALAPAEVARVTWRKEPPTEPGFYPRRESGRARVVEVDKDGEVFFAGVEVSGDVGSPGAEWGPRIDLGDAVTIEVRKG
jgi:hypothetical protein